eukprot:363560-Chlamydomonas_euryale.AAC.13
MLTPLPPSHSHAHCQHADGSAETCDLETNTTDGNFTKTVQPLVPTTYEDFDAINDTITDESGGEWCVLRCVGTGHVLCAGSGVLRCVGTKEAWGELSGVCCAVWVLGRHGVSGVSAPRCLGAGEVRGVMRAALHCGRAMEVRRGLHAALRRAAQRCSMCDCASLEDWGGCGVARGCTCWGEGGGKCQDTARCGGWSGAACAWRGGKAICSDLGGKG